MKCEDVINRFLMLDNFRHIPLTIRIHMATCTRCRREITELQCILVSLHQSPPHSVSIEDNVMRVVTYQRQYYRKVSHSHWLIAGAILLSSVALISYSTTLHWLELHFGNSILIPIYLILGCSLSGFIASYVATHMKTIRQISRNIKLLS